MILPHTLKLKQWSTKIRLLRDWNWNNDQLKYVFEMVFPHTETEIMINKNTSLRLFFCTLGDHSNWNNDQQNIYLIVLPHDQPDEIINKCMVSSRWLFHTFGDPPLGDGIGVEMILPHTWSVITNHTFFIFPLAPLN